MTLADLQPYLLPTDRDDWDVLLAHWRPLIPEGSSRWLLSRFGELFVEQVDGTIGMLQVSGFQYQVVAKSKRDFEEWLVDPDKMSEWFLARLVDYMVGSGQRLQPGYCYSFKRALALGGQIAVENVMMIPVHEHFGLWGEVYEQVKDLPPGSNVVLRFK
jgi:hypothetical protein